MRVWEGIHSKESWDANVPKVSVQDLELNLYNPIKFSMATSRSKLFLTMNADEAILFATNLLNEAKKVKQKQRK